MNHLKKICCFGMILVVLVAFISCDRNPSFPEDSDTESDTAVLLPNEDIPLPTFGSYAEYWYFIHSVTLPKTFITYDLIADFGKFENLVIQENGQLDLKYETYGYSLSTSSGCEFGFYIKSEPFVFLYDFEIISDINPEDMRKPRFSEEGKYEKDGIFYTYFNGELRSILWEVNGIFYNLAFFEDSRLENITLSDSSTLGKLLNLQTAEQVVDSFRTENARRQMTGETDEFYFKYDEVMFEYQAKKQKSFVTYDTIKDFGAFLQLNNLGLKDLSSEIIYSYYVYCLQDNNTKERVDLYIDHKGNFYDFKYAGYNMEEITDVNPEDMRRTVSSEQGKYRKDGITYTYTKGRLVSVEWKVDEISYLLSFASVSDINNILTDTSTTLGKLLKLRTAVQVVDSFKTPEARQQMISDSFQ